MCDLRHNRCRPCPEAAAHRRRDDDEIRPLKHLTNRLFLAACCLLTDLDSAARAASLRQFFTDGQHGDPLFFERMQLAKIRVEPNECHIEIVVLTHTAQDIPAAAAHADHLDGNFRLNNSLSRHIAPPYSLHAFGVACAMTAPASSSAQPSTCTALIVSPRTAQPATAANTASIDMRIAACVGSTCACPKI